jgi:nucleoside-diphosphate-sugar epimerase
MESVEQGSVARPAELQAARVMVTGATGQIGHFLLPRLVRDGHAVHLR